MANRDAIPVVYVAGAAVEVETLSDSDIASLIGRFSKELAAEQLQHVVPEASERLNNGAAANTDVSRAVGIVNGRYQVDGCGERGSRFPT